MSQSSSAGFEVFLFENVLALGTPEAKHQLALQLVELVADPATPEIELKQVSPFLVRLAKDPNRLTREAIATGLKPAKTLQQELIFTILADDEDIALPFLAEAQSITADVQLAIVRAGDEIQQTIVASQEKLNPDTISTFAQKGAKDAVIELLNNKSSTLKPADFKAIDKRFDKDSEIKAAMFDRPDLSLMLRLKHAREATQNLRQMLIDTGWMSSFARLETCKEAENAAVIQALAEAMPDEIHEGLVFLNGQNFLSASLIIRCAVLGKMQVFDAILAFLTGMQTAPLLKSLYSGNNKAQRAIFARAGLPESCYGVLCAACDVLRNTQNLVESTESNDFGSHVLEMLMTRYEQMSNVERATQLDHLSRFGQENLRPLAAQVRTEFLRAA